MEHQTVGRALTLTDLIDAAGGRSPVWVQLRDFTGRWSDLAVAEVQAHPEAIEGDPRAVVVLAPLPIADCGTAMIVPDRLTEAVAGLCDAAEEWVATSLPLVADPDQQDGRSLREEVVRLRATIEDHLRTCPRVDGISGASRDADRIAALEAKLAEFEAVGLRVDDDGVLAVPDLKVGCICLTANDGAIMGYLRTSPKGVSVQLFDGAGDERVTLEVTSEGLLIQSPTGDFTPMLLGQSAGHPGAVGAPPL